MALNQLGEINPQIVIYIDFYPVPECILHDIKCRLLKRIYQNGLIPGIDDPVFPHPRIRK